MSTTYAFRTDWRGLGLVVLVHVALLFALLNIKPVADAVRLPQPLMVSLLAAEPEPAKELPKPQPPGPQVQPVRQVQAPPVLAAREEAATPIAVPSPPPQPVPAVLPETTPQPPQPAAAVAAPPAPVIPPRFDAAYLDNPAPAYPALSRRLGEQGRVLLRVLVSADGNAAQVEIRESSGYQRLDKAARDTVQRWRFVPARQADQGVAAWVQVPISFSLRS